MKWCGKNLLLPQQCFATRSRKVPPQLCSKCRLSVQPRIQSLAKVFSSRSEPLPKPQLQNPAQACADHIPHPIGRLLHSSAEFIVLFEPPRSAMRGDHYMLTM